MRGLADRAPFYAKSTFGADIDAAVGTDRPLAGDFGTGINAHVKYIGTMQDIDLGAIIAPRRRVAVGWNGKINGGTA
jgi:hypothetical protein